MISLKLIQSIFFFNYSFKKAILIAARNLPDANGNRLIKEYQLMKKIKGSQRIQSFGHWFMMRLTKKSLLLFMAAQKAGLTKDEAYQLTENVVWKIAQPLGIALNQLTYFVRSTPAKRIAYINQILWNLLWTAPFKRENIKSKGGVYSFDVIQCPVSDYLKRNNAAQLCTVAFCNADYKLAAQWSTVFKRENTLVTGCSKCDFKFITHS